MSTGFHRARRSAGVVCAAAEHASSRTANGKRDFPFMKTSYPASALHQEAGDSGGRPAFMEITALHANQLEEPEKGLQMKLPGRISTCNGVSVPTALTQPAYGLTRVHIVAGGLWTSPTCNTRLSSLKLPGPVSPSASGPGKRRLT